MKISQEAREAAADFADWQEFFSECDVDQLARAMQSLINSTLERAAAEADAADMRGFRTGEAQTYIVTAIRQLIEE